MSAHQCIEMLNDIEISNVPPPALLRPITPNTFLHALASHYMTTSSVSSVVYFLGAIHTCSNHFSSRRIFVIARLPLLPVLTIISTLLSIPHQSILGRSKLLKEGKADVAMLMFPLLPYDFATSVRTQLSLSYIIWLHLHLCVLLPHFRPKPSWSIVFMDLVQDDLSNQKTTCKNNCKH